jgi:methionyl-tRNA synthetase
MLDPIDLIEPRSRIDGLPPVFRDTRHLFLDLPAFKERLTGWIQAQEHWRPNVRNFSLRYVEELRPRAVTRDLDWGIPVPVEGYPPEEKRIYVWIDAVVGYFSAAVEWARNRGTPDAWRDWWQDPEARHFYFMGKDNIVFHSVIWPAELLGYDGAGELAAGRDLELPYNIVSSEFLTYEGRQFSTSRGHVIYVGDFLDRYDADPLRYYLTAAGPETQDADFSWAEFVRRNNDELLANWGNLVNRTLVNAHRHFGAVPEPGEPAEADRRLLEEVAAGFETVGSLIEAARFRAALAEAMRLSALANAYVAEQEPWALVKTDRERAGTVLYTALRAVDDLKMLLAPFLPFSSQRVHELLGGEGWLAGPLEVRTVDEGDGVTHEVLTGDYESWIGAWQPGDLPPGRALPEPQPLFRKLDAEAVARTELA